MAAIICVDGFQHLARWFSKTNVFGMAAKKERWHYIHVLIDGHFSFPKHPKKLFEVKFFVCELFATFYVFHK